MNERTNQILFCLLRSAVTGATLAEEERARLTPDILARLEALAKAHDMAHLLAFSMQQNGFNPSAQLQKNMFEAIYRAEQRERDFRNVCEALSRAQIPFIPLKGAVLKQYYPEVWMRTSCDIDVLVKNEDLARASACLVQVLGYTEKERGPHDLSLFTPEGNHVELHFDLIVEGRANNAREILQSVWDHAHPEGGDGYAFLLSDAFFYLYHVAHMAKHIETGGCGIRPFLDLVILDGLEGVDLEARNELLEKANLLKFAHAARKLSRVWFGDDAADAATMALESFILTGGVYGSTDNKVALQQNKRGGRMGYLLSRMFLPFDRLKRYYPVLEKHPWLMPFMQIRRWFMLLRPSVAKMARREMKVNKNLDSKKSAEMKALLEELGL